MDPLEILVIIFGLLNLAFAGFLYAHSNKSAVITFYSLISVFASLWSLSTLLTAVGLPFAYFRYALDGHYIFGYLAYLSFFWFALYFPTRSSINRLPVIIISLATIVFVACIPFTKLLFLSVVPGATLAQEITFNPAGYTCFILMLSAVFFLGLIILLVRLQRAARMQPISR